MHTNTRNDLTVALLLVVLGSVVGLAVNWKLVASAWSGQINETESKESLPPGISNVTLEEAKQLFDAKRALVVDARRDFFYNKERIRGAVSFPLAQYDQKLPQFAQQVAKDRLLLLYCSGYGCEDSHDLGEKLQQAGYQHLRVFPGGIPDWKQAGYPTEGTDVGAPK